MRTFRLTEPVHVRDAEDAPLPGHYEVDVETSDGGSVHRFATDKGRAEILRRLDAGNPDISEDDLEELTVAPDMCALLAQMDREAGEGA